MILFYGVPSVYQIYSQARTSLNNCPCLVLSCPYVLSAEAGQNRSAKKLGLDGGWSKCFFAGSDCSERICCDEKRFGSRVIDLLIFRILAFPLSTPRKVIGSRILCHFGVALWSYLYDHNYMRTIPAGRFKSECLGLMDEVQATCEPVIITKHGKPVAKLVPVDPDSDDIFGFLAGKGRIVGDVMSPVIEMDDWDRLR
jgi:prevent-host-death family protein